MVSFDKEVFFDEVREHLFHGVLSQEQVTGMNFILREWRNRFEFGGDYRHLAYMLATTYHECAFRMVPITEYGSQSYLQSKPYYPYIGRGFVQLTWDYNYKKAGSAVEEDLLSFPDMALRPDLAAIIMFDGMRDGWFTGKKLSSYFSKNVDDPYNARRIINGTDRASEIAGYHDKFLSAITKAVA
jgi:predicted chitinase